MSSELPPHHGDDPTLPGDGQRIDTDEFFDHAPTGAAPPTRQKRKKRRRQQKLGCFPTVLLVSGMALGIVLLVGTILGIILYNSLATELEADLLILESMAGIEEFESSRIYSRDGDLLYELFGEGRRTEITIDEVPFTVRWATIATEDGTFYENPGFDPESLTRAALEWYEEGEIVSGGSTITQQLVRQIVFDYAERQEQTLRRKLKEIALAWVMTQRFTKDEILELYLNEIYYGNLAYGIEGAANVYFDKPAADLTIGEAAFLTGLIQSPVGYDPYTYFDIAKGRQGQVLTLMVRDGYITQADADAAYAASPLSVDDLASPDIPLVAPHFTVEARRALTELPGIDAELLARGGLSITTTIDLDMQDLAEQIVAQRVAEVREEHNLNNAALIAIHPYTGEVLAMVGSVNYNDETIDGAVNNTVALHQPGSSMKPLTYAAALESGWTAADIIWDVPMAFDTGVGAGFDYEPGNYDLRYHGPVRLRDALANSYNIPAVLVMREVGVPRLLEIANRFGIESLVQDASYYGLSLTLGGGEVQLIEMASAYAVFASGGHRIEPHLVARVEDRDGNVIYEAPTEPGERVLDERVAFVISDILSDNAARTPAMGSESDLLLPFPAAAKTGTTNDYRDNLTIGYTPHLVVGVWAGNTDNSPMADGTSGLTGAAPIWNDFFSTVYSRPDLTALLENPALPGIGAEFTAPDGVSENAVCILSSLRDPVPAEGGCPRSSTEWFIDWTDEELLEITGGTPEPTPTNAPTPTPRVDEAGNPLPGLGPARVVIEEGILAMAVLAIPEEAQEQVEEAVRAAFAAADYPDGVPSPATPPYCILNGEGLEAEGASFQVFIAAPSNPVDAIRARNWAYRNGVPIEPNLPCSDDLITVAVDPGDLTSDPETGAAYAIASPRPEQEVYGILPVIGTAMWSSPLIDYYKVEIQVVDGSPNPWITIGDIHRLQVENDVLEMLHAEALTPGPYLLRLAIVRIDGSELQHFVIPITVVPNPTPTPGA